MTGRVGSIRSSAAVLIALEEGRGRSCMAWTFILHVTVLLVPGLYGRANKAPAARSAEPIFISLGLIRAP